MSQLTTGPNHSIKNIREKKRWKEDEAKESQQVGVNGQWHVSTMARLSAGAWAAEIFKRLTEWETHSLRISWSGEREKGRERERCHFPTSSLHWSTAHSSNGQHHMNNVQVRLLVFTYSFSAQRGGPLLRFAYRQSFEDEEVWQQTFGLSWPHLGLRSHSFQSLRFLSWVVMTGQNRVLESPLAVRLQNKTKKKKNSYMSHDAHLFSTIQDAWIVLRLYF